MSENYHKLPQTQILYITVFNLQFSNILADKFVFLRHLWLIKYFDIHFLDLFEFLTGILRVWNLIGKVWLVSIP